MDEGAADQSLARLASASLEDHALETNATGSLHQVVGGVRPGRTSTPERPAPVERAPAKGLEFDHVAVLDEGWNRIGHSENPGEAHWLYYVAMTGSPALAST